MICKRLAVLAAAFIAAGAFAANDSFTLTDIRDLRTYGPFPRMDGAKASIGGADYRIKMQWQGRISFVSLSSGVEWGPIQIIEGRLGVIGGKTYKVSLSATGQPSAGTRRTGSGASSFVQQPPAMPEMIEIPEPQPRRSVAPLDLPLLPKTEDILMASAWLAPVDNEPADWKINSKSAGDGDIKRISVGAAIDWREWRLSGSYSPSVKGDGIRSGGTGLVNASLDDGTGWAIGIRYMRPFLIEGGWSAKAGIRGMLRRDSGDLKSSSLVSSGESDTNIVGNVKSSYENRTTTAEFTELSLWIDLELAYSGNGWGAKAGISMVPISEFDISASIPYGHSSIKLDAERSTPIAVSAGGWYEYEDWRFFSDLSFGADSMFRMGVARGF